jgi:hypothetical protein
VAIITSKTRIPLDDRWDLYVVNKGPNQTVILSIVELGTGPVTERIAINLRPDQATRIAMALASVTGRSLA